MAALGWPAIASIVYFSLYFLLLFWLAFYVHKTGEFKDKKSFFMAVWKKRGIYGQILLHLYDTATDFGVLVEWYLLAQDEKNGEYDVNSLDMSSLFWASIAFIILYRLMSVGVGCTNATDYGGLGWMCFDGCCLGLTDMYIIKTVYNAIKGNKTEPTEGQKAIQLGECVFESIPQMVLQSVFIIRGQNDPQLLKQSNFILVQFSLFASLLSVTTKFIWIDAGGVREGKEAKWEKPKCKPCQRRGDEKSDVDTTKDVESGATETVQSNSDANKNKDHFLCVNKWYLLRVLWRFSHIVVKFCILSLLWSVLGGAFIGIFLGTSFILWYGLISVLFFVTKEEDLHVGFFIFTIPLMAMISLAGTIALQSYSWFIAHVIEVLTALAIITWFAFDSSIQCGICAVPGERQANDNDYILSFIVVGWAAMVIDFITYFILLKCKLFDDKMGAMYVFFEGLGSTDDD